MPAEIGLPSFRTVMHNCKTSFLSLFGTQSNLKMALMSEGRF